MSKELVNRRTFLQLAACATTELVAYATQPDGSLKEIASAKIPHNGPQGLAGF